MTVHLRQEIDRLNVVVKLTTSTLKNLRLAIAGELTASWVYVVAPSLRSSRMPDVCRCHSGRFALTRAIMATSLMLTEQMPEHDFLL